MRLTIDMKVDEKQLKEIYEHFEKSLGFPDNVKMVEKYNQEAMLGFGILRRSSMRPPPEGALPNKVKELIITAVETALRVPADGHARRAIKEGATVQEVHEALMLVLWLAGMTTFAVSGRKAVEAAEQAVKEMAVEKKR